VRGLLLLQLRGGSLLEVSVCFDFSDFPVTTPPRLTREEFLTFMDTIPLPPSLLLVAAEDGRVDILQRIFRELPDVDVNFVPPYGSGALHLACQSGNPAVVSCLLAHPDIDVNVKNFQEQTPFFYACFRGEEACVQALLLDLRVNTNEPDAQGYTPIREAAYWGHSEAIKWWIASGRELLLGEAGNEKTDPVGQAREANEGELAELLERFRGNPEETRYAVRLDIGWFDERAAEVFALSVFVSDGLLLVKETPNQATRFFRLIRQLPLELQMILCHVVVGSPRENIAGFYTEAAFKALASTLQ